MFSYPDTQRHRLGANFDQIPVNCPINGSINYQRDGAAVFNNNGGSAPNYEPNSLGGVTEDKSVAEKPFTVSGLAQRNKFHLADPEHDFEQPRAFWTKVMKEENKEYLVSSMAGSMKGIRPDIKERMIKLAHRVHPEFGTRLAKGLGMSSESPKL